MSVVDYEIAERTSKEFLKLLEDCESIPDSVFNNCLTALFSYRNTHRETFDFGVTYGMVLCIYYYKTLVKNQE